MNRRMFLGAWGAVLACGSGQAVAAEAKHLVRSTSEIHRECLPAYKRLGYQVDYSYPVPIRHAVGAGYRWLAFHCQAVHNPVTGVSSAYPPAWLATHEADGTLVLLESVSAWELGYRSLGALLGIGGAVALTPADGAPQPSVPPVLRQERLLSLYDTMVQGWLDDAPIDATQADLFRSLFVSLVPAPFLPVYRHLGPEFFARMGIA